MRSKINDYKKVSLMIEIYIIIDVREQEDSCRRKLKIIISRGLEKNPRYRRTNGDGEYEKETMEESRLTGEV